MNKTFDGRNMNPNLGRPTYDVVVVSSVADLKELS